MDFDMIEVRSLPLTGGGAVGNQRHFLCEDLLDVIRDSVKVFRPSRSMDSLKSLDPAESPAMEIDITISGGGLKGYFMTGCSHILQHELRKQNVKIARISGASAGAWCGLFMLTDFSTNNWLETYYLCKERSHLTMHEAYNDVWPWIESHLPENAWEICSGRLFISITELTIFGFKNHIISEYTSNRDIFDACLASSTVPYISLPHMLKQFRGMWCLDGGITNNTPVFTDNLRRQLVFRLSDVFYPTKFLIHPHDFCIEALVVRGAILMSKFLQGEPSDSFSWVYPNTGTTDDAARHNSGGRSNSLSQGTAMSGGGGGDAAVERDCNLCCAHRRMQNSEIVMAKGGGAGGGGCKSAWRNILWYSCVVAFGSVSVYYLLKEEDRKELVVYLREFVE